MITQYNCPKCLETWKRKGVISNKLKVTFHLCPNCSEKVEWYKTEDEGVFDQPCKI